MAKALNAMRIRAWRRPAGANRLTEERTLGLIAPRQQRDEISGNSAGNINGPLIRQRVNQCGQSRDSRFSGH
jgi:hypothetical protein